MNIFKQTYIHIFLYAINVLRTCVYIHTDNENGRRDILVRMRVILPVFFFRLSVDVKLITVGVNSLIIVSNRSITSMMSALNS